MMSAITGVIQPATGTKERTNNERIYTVCHSILRNETAMLRKISVPSFEKENWKFRFSIMASVFSLRYANTGEPTINQIYLKREKYSKTKISQNIKVAKAKTKFNNPS